MSLLIPLSFLIPSCIYLPIFLCQNLGGVRRHCQFCYCSWLSHLPHNKQCLCKQSASPPRWQSVKNL